MDAILGREREVGGGRESWRFGGFNWGGHGLPLDLPGGVTDAKAYRCYLSKGQREMESERDKGHGLTLDLLYRSRVHFKTGHSFMKNTIKDLVFIVVLYTFW